MSTVLPTVAKISQSSTSTLTIDQSIDSPLSAAITVSQSESEWISFEPSTDAGDVPTAEVVGTVSSDIFEVLSPVDLFDCCCGLTTFLDFSAAFLTFLQLFLQVAIFLLLFSSCSFFFLLLFFFFSCFAHNISYPCQYLSSHYSCTCSSSFFR